MMGLDPGMLGHNLRHGIGVELACNTAAAREGVEQRVREEGMSGRPDLPLLRVYVSEAGSLVY